MKRQDDKRLQKNAAPERKALNPHLPTSFSSAETPIFSNFPDKVVCAGNMITV